MVHLKSICQFAALARGGFMMSRGHCRVHCRVHCRDCKWNVDVRVWTVFEQRVFLRIPQNTWPVDTVRTSRHEKRKLNHSQQRFELLGTRNTKWMSIPTGDQKRRVSVHLRSLPYCEGKISITFINVWGKTQISWNTETLCLSLLLQRSCPFTLFQEICPRNRDIFLGAWKHLATQFQNESTEENICPKSNQI